MRRRGLADRADRPIRRHPFSRCVGQNGGEADQPGFVVDRRRLHGCDLVPAKRLADDVESR